jgi:hypothetical protein
MGHLWLTTVRNTGRRIITHGTVVENQKTGSTATQKAARHARQPAGAELAERSQTAPPLKLGQPVYKLWMVIDVSGAGDVNL